MAGTRAAEYCAEYAPDETIDVKNINDRIEGCRKMSLFGNGCYEKGGVLRTARPGRDGRRQEQEVLNQRL